MRYVLYMPCVVFYICEVCDDTIWERPRWYFVAFVLSIELVFVAHDRLHLKCKRQTSIDKSGRDQVFLLGKEIESGIYFTVSTYSASIRQSSFRSK